MLIKLTNALPQYKGLTVLLNANIIQSAMQNTVTRDDGTLETVTTVHCPPHGTWEITETPEEIYDQAKSLKLDTNTSANLAQLLSENQSGAGAPKKNRKNKDQDQEQA